MGSLIFKDLSIWQLRSFSKRQQSGSVLSPVLDHMISLRKVDMCSAECKKPDFDVQVGFPNGDKLASFSV